MGGELAPVTAFIGHFMGNNQMVLGINNRLNVIAHDAVPPALHGACIRIGQRYLLVRCFLQFHFNRL